jgi:hypothetical protein
MNEEPIVIVRDIIKTQLGLSDEDIWLENQGLRIPETSGLFIVLSQVNSTSFSNNTKYIENETQDGIVETQSMNTQEEIAIDVFSKNREANIRKEEIRLALNSYYSDQQQEIFQFKIANINNPFLNISAVEGEGMLNRFRLTVTVLSWYSRSAPVDFYDKNFEPETIFEPEPE